MSKDLSMFPHSLAAERSVLGSIILDNNTLYAVAEFLTENDFYMAAHKILYRVMAEMITAGVAVDLVTIKNVLDKRKLLDDAGGIAYIAAMIDGVGSTGHIEHYGRIVKENASLRQIKQAAYDALHNDEETAEEISSKLGSALIDAADPSAGTVMDADEAGLAQSNLYEEAMRNPQTVGYPIGIPFFDETTLGLKPGELSVWGGCPSSGKTSVLSTAVLNMPEVPSGIISIETTRAGMMDRLIAGETGIDLTRIISRNLSPWEWKQCHNAAGKLASRGKKLWICDRAPMTLDAIAALIKKRKISHGTKIVWIDFFNLISHHPTAKNIQYKAHEVYVEISKGLKALTKNLNVHIGLLLQLTKDLARDQEPDRRHMTDTRRLEWDADVIVFLWQQEGSIVGEMETMWTIYKNRNGSLARFAVPYRKNIVRFGA